MAQGRITESKFSFGSIAAMGPWSFWARKDAIGLDAETLRAIEAGTLSEAQQAVTYHLGMAAKEALISAEVCMPYIRRPS